MARAFVAASSQFVEYNGAGGIPTGGYPFTFSCWFKPNSLHQAFLVTESQRAGTHYVSLLILASGHLRAQLDPGTGAILAETTASYTANAWHHACAVFTNNNSRTIYLDGANAVTTTTACFYPSAMDTISAGRLIISSAGSNYFDGSLAEVFIINRALSAAEIAALASGTPPARSVVKFAQSLYWPLWGLASPEIDAIGGGRSGTVTGATRTNHSPTGTYSP